jgi:hypothetical protein
MVGIVYFKKQHNALVFLPVSYIDVEVSACSNLQVNAFGTGAKSCAF